MKEIKFRAWDKSRKCWVEDFSYQGGDWWIDEYRNDTLESRRPFENVELMQFTGIKDRNGQDIYEGDIVKCVSEILKPFERANKIKTGRFSTKYLAIEYRNKSASFCITGSALSGISQAIATKYYEVIGNIYESDIVINKLLEEKN